MFPLQVSLLNVSFGHLFLSLFSKKMIYMLGHGARENELSKNNFFHENQLHVNKNKNKKVMATRQ